MKAMIILFVVLVLCSCASTYYTDLPSRQPEIYTETSFEKDKQIEDVKEKEKKNYTEDFEESFDEPDDYDVAFNESEAIIEALSERLSYYEELEKTNGLIVSDSDKKPDENILTGSSDYFDFADDVILSAPDLISMNNKDSSKTVSGKYNFSNSTTIYSYVKGMVYDVYYHPERSTSIKLQEGETLSYAALGDTVNWTIETLDNSEEDASYTYVLLRPYVEGETDLHLYTDKRVYHFHLISTFKTYQVQVEFRYPETSSLVSKPVKLQGENKKSSSDYQTATGLSKGVKDLNFNYKITGNASWKPVRAYSDTVRTYIQFSNSFVTNSETPIVLLRHNGRDEIVDFTGKGITYIIPLILSTNEIFVLKAGKTECYVGY